MTAVSEVPVPEAAIRTAGGARAPVYETFVRLSRGGVTATIPMELLVSNPAENIYAYPGDVLTLVRLPQSFSVFGATGSGAVHLQRVDDHHLSAVNG